MQKLLIVGSGDVACRCLPRLLGRYRVYALLREPAQASFWRARGVRLVVADLDDRSSLTRISGLADIVLHFAPPSEKGEVDARTRRLLAALACGKSLPRQLVYISTTGVYSDCAGAHIDETRKPAPKTARARRRVDAEKQLRRIGARCGVCVSILRAPGIYATDRLPIERLQKGVPALRGEDDVYTNHIHADDLAGLACAVLRYGRPSRCYNATDDSDMKMGDYFDLVAERFNLPKAPRISRLEAEARLSPVQLSFMSESRRIDNTRIKKELRFRLRYPQVADGIGAAREERGV